MNNFTESFNPATGKLIGKSELHSVEDLTGMIKKGREAQKKWAGLPVDDRIGFVIKIRKYLVEHVDELAETISSDNGKTRIDSLATEILPASMAVSYYCKNAKKFLKDKKLSAGNIFLINKRSKIIRVPYGVVGIISPWNYPFTIPFSEVIMALLSGNSVILKVASETQLVGLALKKAIECSGIPEGVFNYINLPGRIAGDAFIDEGVDKIFFTGSVPIGKYLLEKSAKKLTPLVLELGGNDPMIVCGDADPFRAAMGALWGGFQNAGQSCGGVERIYAHEKIYDEFISILKKNIECLRVDGSSNINADMGCMTTKKQMETVNSHVQDALKLGAKIFAQSKIPVNAEGNFIPAMVLTDVNHEMLLMKDETFGPVVGVMKFSNYDEAIRLANDSNLGLTASVWTRNNSLGEKIARQIKAGAVTINDHLMSHGLAETPWGGFKDSGIGRTHGQPGFDEMTQSIVIVKDIMPFVKRNVWWHPFSYDLYQGIKGIMELLYHQSFKRKIVGMKNLLKIITRIFIK
jgi:acyl-CoA reductase-like NAD-dependent aldehyde dehydrogenase